MQTTAASPGYARERAVTCVYVRARMHAKCVITVICA